MKRLYVVLGTMLISLSSILIYAHDYRPLLVQVTEEPDGRYVLRWQPSPVLRASDQPVVKLVGAGCKREADSLLVDDARRNSYRCGDSPTPLRVELTYPNDNPSLPTLVNMTRADGTVVQITGSPGGQSIILSRPQTQSLRAQAYALIGFDHILRGYDHLIFLSFLWLIIGTGWTLIRALTGFTLGHSVTLAVASAGMTKLSAPFVESMIALSIVLLASEFLKKDRTTLTHRYPAMVSALFGLLHGFGFAGYLSEVGLPKNDALTALLMFNVGVEAGQIVFVLFVIAIGVTLKKFGAALLSGKQSLIDEALEHKFRMSVAYAGGITAAYWLIERTWGGLHL
jgi:hydrogenase/urease accessory protein HupE